MRRYTNSSGLPLSIAVWLATDFYDHNDDPWTISVTSLMKSVRQVILASRIPPGEVLPDVMGLTQSRFGTAVHNGIEQAWLTNYQTALRDLGYPAKVIQRVRINPAPGSLEPGDIPVYFEQRASKQVGHWTVTGKFDFVFDGALEDVKTTGVYSWIAGTKDEDYSLQGSLYHWLNPELVTQDEMKINFLFTDWKQRELKQNPNNYPPQRIVAKRFPLKPANEVQRFVEQKLELFEFYRDTPEAELPECTDEELWRSAPQWKYYKDPSKTTRSTKNFDNEHDAQLRFIEDGGVGLIKRVAGQAKACLYCPAFTLCSQKDRLLAEGAL